MYFPKTDVRYRKVFLTNILILISALILSFYIIYNLYATKLYLLAGLEVISLMATFTAYYLLRYRHNIELAATIMILMVYLLTLIFIYNRQHHDFAIMQALFLPMIAILLKGKRVGMLYALSYIALIMAIAFTGIDSWEPARFTLSSFVNIGITFAFLIALIYYYELSRQEAYSELDQYKNNLIQKVDATLEEKRSQEQILIQQSKMAAMGEMLGAITHQWKQPLSTIPSIILQMKLDIHENSEVMKLFEENLDNILKQVEYMTQTSRDFTRFFRPSLHEEKIDLLQAIDDVLLLLEYQLHIHNIKVELKLGQNMVLKGRRNEFLQVLLNILNNAKDAILEHISQGKLKAGEGIILIHAFKEQDRIILEIEDNGGGIPQELLKQIFDPYFSTKSEQQGSGIGLYMAKMIVEKKMHGKLSVSNHGKGARFHFEF